MADALEAMRRANDRAAGRDDMAPVREAMARPVEPGLDPLKVIDGLAELLAEFLALDGIDELAEDERGQEGLELVAKARIALALIETMRPW